MKTKEIGLIHLGLPKAGSTFLQKEFFPKLPFDVISNENLSGTTSTFKIELDLGMSLSRLRKYSILQNLKKIYGDVPVLLVIRDKDSWIQSNYNQMVKNGLYGNTFEYFYNHMDKELLNFDNYINNIKKVFSNVFIIDFEILKNNPQKFVDEICDWLNLESYKINSIIYNPSLSNNLLNLKRFCNRCYDYFWNHVYKINGGK